jgi:ParB family chromosome partitioning protein
VLFSCDEKGKGKITIPFENEKDLERIVRIFDSLKNNN